MSAPQKYRKKPVEVTAMQLTDDNLRDVQAWCNADGTHVVVQWHPISAESKKREGWLVLTTAHGDEAIARPGDWVVPEADTGAFYPVKPDVFAATYEAVSGPQSDCACGQPVDVEGDADSDSTLYVEDCGFWHRRCWEQYKREARAAAEVIAATEFDARTVSS